MLNFWSDGLKLSLISWHSAKETQKEEYLHKEKWIQLEKIAELREQHDEAILRKDAEIDRLKHIVREKDHLIKNHNIELEHLKLEHAKIQHDLQKKLDQLTTQGQDLRLSHNFFNTQMQISTKNYEEMLSQFKSNEVWLKREIFDLKSVIKQLNNENEALKTHKNMLSETLQEINSKLRNDKKNCKHYFCLIFAFYS